MHIDVKTWDKERIVKNIADWLDGKGEYDHDEHIAKPPKECILNVAGSRESAVDGIQELVMEIVVRVLIGGDEDE